MSERKYEALVDAALLGIAAFVGVPVQDMMKQLEHGNTGKKEQGIGEFCGGSSVAECTATFGKEALFLACRTCPY